MKGLDCPHCTADQVLEYAAQAEQLSVHPIAVSVPAAYGKELNREGVEDYREIPGQGILVSVQNKKLAVGNSALLEAEKVSYTPCEKAGTKVYVAVDGIYTGRIVISDTVKADSKQTIAELKRMGIEKP